MIKRNFPQYHFSMRGSEAIRIRYEGQDLGVFDSFSLWEAYRKTVSELGGTNDPKKRYVIERAIEQLEGKVPKTYIRTKRGEFVATPRWNRRSLGLQSPAALPPLSEIKRRKQKRKNLLSRILDRLLGSR